MDVFSGLKKALGDKLSGPVDIRLVLKINTNNGQGKGGKGADIFDPRQTKHRRFDRVRYESFNFFRSHAFGFCVDLDERRGRIRKDIYGQSLEGEKT
jgi:hypothetical protein